VLTDAQTIEGKCTQFIEGESVFSWDESPNMSEVEILVPGAKFCSWCGKKGHVKVCSECKHSFYCDYECQKRHWRIHKGYCKSFASMRTATGFHTMMLTQQCNAVSMFTPEDDDVCF